MIWVKNLNFHASLFFEREHLATLLNNVLERKPAFLNYKKGLTHDFGQKFELSCISVFREKTPGYTSK